eukprot:TCALIF_01229-PA protein Name:"Similar to A Dihydroflavonol-4-reductase (Dianthus caryophyllus)" AED:0.36 eAED:0.42 QI:0/0/0/0.28/1/1/7/0/310
MTSASGFLGSHVVAQALAKGHKVRAVMRNPDDVTKTSWLMKLYKAEGNLTFHAGDLDQLGSFDEAIKGSEAVVVCAFPETPSEPKLIETVRGGALHILKSCTDHGVKTIVLTSSGGSTNPKEGEPPVKNEMDHWSDPDYQISQGKYSPAAKTLMDQAALQYGKDHPELRVVVLNPNLIMGPMFQPDLPAKGSLNMLLSILKRERLDKIPNGSMSIIDVRDLAALELAAVENPHAAGRYFGVLRSFHWKEIMEAIHEVHPEFEVPPVGYEGDDVRPTQFDHSRKESLGVKLRDLKTILHDAINDLKARKLL